jgi:hypothetical protein
LTAARGSSKDRNKPVMGQQGVEEFPMLDVGLVEGEAACSVVATVRSGG